MSTDDLALFSSTVQESNEKFSEACIRRGLDVQSFAHPQTGPGGEALHTLVCRIGPRDANRAMLVISGTHGIEGYAGAAIQTGLVRDLSDMPLPPSMAVVMVHQINPWGCAWGRRENEDNVDLFRNFLYCDPPYAVNSEYARLADALAPTQWLGPARDAAEATLREYEDLHGPGSVVAVARRGQHDFPKGLTYHGRGPTWSKRLIDSVVSAELAGVREIVTYDLHTGYGPYGEGIVAVFAPRGADVITRLESAFGPNLLHPGNDPILPAHAQSPYDRVCEPIGAERVTSFALEFGTVTVTDTFDVLREMSWLFNYGDPTSKSGRDVRRRFRAMFYPEHDDWKHRVWRRGREVFATAVQQLFTSNSRSAG